MLRMCKMFVCHQEAFVKRQEDPPSGLHDSTAKPLLLRPFKFPQARLTSLGEYLWLLASRQAFGKLFCLLLELVHCFWKGGVRDAVGGGGVLYELDES